MSKIGSFGSTISFSVSDKKMLTFRNLQEQLASRWSEVKIQKGLPRQEFLGVELATVSLSVTLDSAHGVKPMETREKLKKCLENGTAEYLTIGGVMLSGNRFVITSLGNAYDVVTVGGAVQKMTVNISLKEYVT